MFQAKQAAERAVVKPKITMKPPLRTALRRAQSSLEAAAEAEAAAKGVRARARRQLRKRRNLPQLLQRAALRRNQLLPIIMIASLAPRLEVRAVVKRLPLLKHLQGALDQQAGPEGQPN
jgi:CRISPR/Cas system-associated protein Csm6